MKIYFTMFILSFNVQVFAGFGWWAIDGNIVDVGYGSVIGLPGYSINGGQPIPLSVPVGYTGSSYRISSDGQIIAGQLSLYDNGVLMNMRGSIWTRTDMIDNIPYYSQPLLLPSLEAMQNNHLRDMSPNGKYLVGDCMLGNKINQYQAVYWDENRNVHSLGSMHHGAILYDYSFAIGVRDDKTIFGNAIAEDSDGEQTLAFVWDEQNGMRYLGDVLEQEYNYNFGDISLISVHFLDAHGYELYGNAYNSSGEMIEWSATIPEPASLLLLCLGAILSYRRK